MKTTSQSFRRLALLLGMSTFGFNAWAQNQATLTRIGRWPEYPMPLVGEGYALGVAGSYVYLAGQVGPLNTLRLAILDVSTPAQPRYLSHVDTLVPAYYPSLCLRSNYAYVSSQASSTVSPLAVFDVSQPATPRLVGSCQPIDTAGWDMDLDRGYLYRPGSFFDPGARHLQGFLQVLNVDDPANPALDTTLPVSVDGFVPGAVAVAGQYLYAAGIVRPGPQNQSEFDYVHIDIIDVSNPSFPFVASGYDKPDRLYPQASCAQGGLLHLVSWGNEVPSVYETYDLSDPLNPSPVGSYALQPTEYILTLRLRGNLAYLTTSAGLRVFDISDPRDLRVIAFMPLAVNWSFGNYNFDLAGDYAYWHEMATEVRVLQLTNPAAPGQVAVFETAFNAPQLSVEGNRAYLLEADSKRFRVLDVSSPREPALIARAQLTYAGHFKVVGQRGYVAADTSLQILNLTDPSQPKQAGWFSAPCTGLDVLGTRAYVTGTSPTNRLTVIEVTNPAVPRLLGYLNLPGSPGPPQVVGNLAFYRLEDTHLVIVDIHDPSRMVEVGRYYATNGLSAFQVSGPYAYLLRRSWGEDASLHVVSLADPAHPTRVGFYAYDPATVTDLQNLYVSGRYAIITFSESGTNRVDILDVTDPTRPVKAGDYFPESQFSSFVMSGSTLYAAGSAGLSILNFFDPNRPLQFYPPFLSAANIALSWTGGPGIKLQKTTSLSAPNWQDVPGSDGVSQFAVPLTNPFAFFRLVKP